MGFIAKRKVMEKILSALSHYCYICRPHLSGHKINNMKKAIFALLALSGFAAQAQSVVQTVNTAALSTASSSVSVGEIFVTPANQPSSGLIGILAQTQQQLEVPQLALTPKLTVYPNPTAAAVYFSGDGKLSGQTVSIFDENGRKISQSVLNAEQSVDLEMLSAGIYLISIGNNKNYTFKIIKH
jgi:hypothetical protein